MLLGTVNAIPAHRNLFGVGGEGGTPLMTSCVAMHVRRLVIWEDVKLGCRPRNCATAPATWGHAIDVPDIVLVAELLAVDAALMLLPGARISTQVPKLEKLDKWSELVVEPTVMARGAEAGEDWHASPESFPAAATTLIPASCSLLTTLFPALLLPPAGGE